MKLKSSKADKVNLKKEFNKIVVRLFKLGNLTPFLNLKKKESKALNGKYKLIGKKGKQKKQRGALKVWLQRIVIFFVIVLLFGFLFIILGLLSLITVYSKDLPNIDKYIEKNRNLGKESVIYDRHGRELYRLRGDLINERLKFEEVPKKLEAAVLASEDANFRRHKGLDMFGLARALSCVALNYLQKKPTNECPGGSSITQQLIKKTTAMEERTYERKIKEMILAMKVEEEYSKDEILEFYMNIVPQGREYVGIKTGAIYLFGKSNLNDLSLAEIAYLAGIPNNPEVFSPRGALYNPDKSLERANYVLNRLYEERAYYGISAEEIEQARAELASVKFIEDKIDIKAPHFVNHLISQLDKEYADKVPEGKKGSDYFRDKGYKIITTVDLDIQELLQKTIKEKVDDKAFQNLIGAQTAAGVVVDNKTGEVLALVGSKDFFAESQDRRFAPKFNGATSPRSMGSSVKPILYMTMFTKGYNPRSIVPDLPLNYSASGRPYIPFNYNRTFLSFFDKRTGRNDFITIRRALENSLNQPAVAGVTMIGVDAFADMYVRLTGDESIRQYFKGPTAALGAANIPLLTHVHAYTTIADYGVYKDLKLILEIRDENNQVILDNRPVKSKRVIDSKYTVVITDLNENYLAFPGNRDIAEVRKKTDFAGKTGTSDTSNAAGDVVVVGYTPQVTIGIWAGNSCGPEECPIKPYASSEKLLELLYAPFLREYVKNFGTSERFKRNEPGVRRVKLCSLTGNAATEECIKAGGEIVEDISAVDPRPEFMLEPYKVTPCDGTLKLARPVDEDVGLAYERYYVRYDKIFQGYTHLSNQVYKYLTTGLEVFNRMWQAPDPIPTEYCGVLRNVGPAQIIINSPSEGSTFNKNSVVNVNVTVISEIPIKKIEIAVDNVIQKVFAPGEPVAMTLDLSGFSIGSHKLKVVVINNKDVESSQEVTFNVIDSS